MALAPTYLLMLCAAAAGGGALAAGNPVTNKLVAIQVPAGERGVITGTKQAGVQMGAFATGALLPGAASAWGWRWALAASVSVPLVGILMALRTRSRERRPASRDEPVTSLRDPIKQAVWWITAYAFLMGVGVASFTAYIPLYAQERVGMSATRAGFVAGLMGGIGILSRIAWGWGSERLASFSIPLVAMGLGAVVASLLVWGAEHAGAWMLWIGAALLGVTAITWNAVGMLAVIGEVEPRDTGRASGYVLTGFYGGFVASPVLFGYSVDRTGEYGWGWGGMALVFVLATLVAASWNRSRRG
jgi:predicted MFS family arabinose efflux permease